MERTALAEITEGHVPITGESVGGLIERSTMSNSRNPLSALAFLAIVGGIVYFTDHREEDNPRRIGKAVHCSRVLPASEGTTTPTLTSQMRWAV